MPRRAKPIERTSVPVNMLAACAFDWTVQYHQILPIALKAIAVGSHKGMISATDLIATFAIEGLRTFPTKYTALYNLERFLVTVGQVCSCPALVSVDLDAVMRTHDPSWKGVS